VAMYDTLCDDEVTVMSWPEKIHLYCTCDIWAIFCQNYVLFQMHIDIISAFVEV
jgi:hypothetical protein